MTRSPGSDYGNGRTCAIGIVSPKPGRAAGIKYCVPLSAETGPRGRNYVLCHVRRFGGHDPIARAEFIDSGLAVRDRDRVPQPDRVGLIKYCCPRIANLVSSIARFPWDWKSGDKLWAVEVIAPFGGAEEMIKDLKAKVFPTKEIRFVALTTEGKKDVRVV